MVSLRPSTFAQGGGLLDDADVELIFARFTIGYGANSSGAGAEATTLKLVLKDGDGTEHEQFYSCGNGFVPSETGDEATAGKELVPVGDKTAPSGGSNMAMVIGSLINAGLPEDLLDSGDISAIEGTKGHVNRIPEPKRAGLPAREGARKDQPRTVLVFTTVTGLPGDAPKPGTKAKVTQMAKSAAATKATAAAPKAEEGADELTEELTGFLLEVVGAAGDAGLKKVQIVQKLFAAIPKDNANKKALVAMAGRDEVLQTIGDGMFEYNGTLIKMA